jgi:hypothetical protein
MSTVAEAGLPALDRAAALIAVAPASWRWDVVGPVSVDGDALYAKLPTSTDGYEPWYFGLSRRQVGGTWNSPRIRCAPSATSSARAAEPPPPQPKHPHDVTAKYS